MIHVKAPVSFTMGSAPTTPPGYKDRTETPHEVRIPRAFAIGAHEVSVTQFKQFAPEFPYDAEVCPSHEGPISKVSWYDAVRFCRWLSEREHIPDSQMCYPEISAIHEGMTVPTDFLERTGYRLPTEAEWEYVARGGTATAYFFGEHARSLKLYAWHANNADYRLWPRGLFKPNPLGVFDIYGNVREWCHDSFAPYDEPADPLAPVRDDVPRVSRGGGYRTQAREARSAHRGDPWPPNTRFSPFGLRIARTLPWSDGARAARPD